MQRNKKQQVIALYRVSTDKQDLTRQQDDLLRVLAVAGYEKDQIIEIGNKESGVLLSAAEREGLNEMKQYVEKGNIAAVYVHELSRLSRRAADTFAVRDYLMQHHVQLVCVNPSIKCFTDDWKVEPTANMVFGIMASMAENEGYIRKERFKSGKARCKALGKRINAVITYGYTVDKNNVFIIDEDAAENVRTLFRLYATGDYSLVKLSKEMTYRGWKIIPASVNRYLTNPCFIGKDKNGTKYPRIIDDELWEKCRAVAAKKSTRIGLGHKRWWLGAKLIKCADCGCHFTVNGDRDYSIYSCPYNAHMNHSHSCENKIRIPAHYFDNILFSIAYEQEMKRRNVNKQEVADRLVKEIDDAADKIAHIEGELNAAIGAKLERLDDMYIDGILSEKKYKERRQRVLDEQADLQSELFRLRDLQAVKQQQWSDIMSGSIKGMEIDFEKWMRGEEVSKLVHDHVKIITASKNEEGFVDIVVECFNGAKYMYQYRAGFRKNHLMWHRVTKKGETVAINLPKSEKNDENGTARFHRITDQER